MAAASDATLARMSNPLPVAAGAAAIVGAGTCAAVGFEAGAEDGTDPEAGTESRPEAGAGIGTAGESLPVDCDLGRSLDVPRRETAASATTFSKELLVGEIQLEEIQLDIGAQVKPATGMSIDSP